MNPSPDISIDQTTKVVSRNILLSEIMFIFMKKPIYYR